MTGIATEEFKMTELGPIPIEWDIIKSREKLLLNDSGVWGDDLNEGEIGIEVLRSTNMQNNQWVFEDIARRRITEEQFKRYWLREGDILITKSSGSRRHIGKAAYVDEAIENRRCIFANFMQRLRFNDDVYPKFAFYFIISETGKNILLSRSTTTTGLRNLQKTDFENIIMPLPPLLKQKKIAAVLSAVREAKEKTEVVIQAARELKKSLMKHLFTYGPVSIDEAENVTLRETEIGLVPEDWEVVRLEKVCELRKEAVEPTNKGLRYIGLEHMDSGETRVNRFGSEDEVRSTKNRFYEGDILYGKLRPYLDKVAIMNFDGICSTDIIVITTSSNRVSADYLVNLLHLPSFLSFATSTMTGVNHPRTSWKALTPFMIPLPSIVTQKRIAETLFTIDQEIEAGENQKRALEALFKTLLSKLMTGKTRVNDLEVSV